MKAGTVMLIGVCALLLCMSGCKRKSAAVKVRQAQLTYWRGVDSGYSVTVTNR